MKKRLSRRRKKVIRRDGILCGQCQEKFADINELLEHYNQKHKAGDVYVVLALSDYVRMMARES